MKKFYIFINEEQLGPLSFEEIKDYKISKETKVWFEGLDDWKNANEIEELKSILISIPPPINSFTSKPPTPKFEKTNEIKIDYLEENEPKILGFKRNLFYGIVVGLIIILGLFYFNNLQNENRINLIEQNRQTEIQNQQKEIEEQKARLAEQELIETNRKKQEEKNKLEIQYTELNQELNILYENLSKAKQNLNNASAFKLLRTSSERNEQINAAQNDVDMINQQIKNIESEIEKINKKLGI